MPKRTMQRPMETVEMFTHPLRYPLANHAGQYVNLLLHVVDTMSTHRPGEKSKTTPCIPQVQQKRFNDLDYLHEKTWDLNLPYIIANRLGIFYNQTMAPSGKIPLYECHQLPSYLFGDDRYIGEQRKHPCIPKNATPVDPNELQAGKPYMATVVKNRLPIIRHVMVGLGPGPISEEHPNGEYAKYSLHVMNSLGPLVIAETALLLNHYGADKVYPIEYRRQNITSLAPIEAS